MNRIQAIQIVQACAQPNSEISDYNFMRPSDSNETKDRRSPYPSGTAQHVLMVDDDRQCQEVLRQALEPAGYTFELAADGRHALGEFILKPFDIVLLALALPDMDGLDVLTEMRRISAVPIIILTARSSPEDIQTSFALGADDYIKKPLAPAQLIERLRAATGSLPIRHPANNHDKPRRI